MLRYISITEELPGKYHITIWFSFGGFGLLIERGMTIQQVFLSLVALTSEMKKHIRVN